MSRAYLHAEPAAEPERRAAGIPTLTGEERAALICAVMAHSIELLQAAERQNLAGAFEASDALRASALALVRAVLKLRRSA